MPFDFGALDHAFFMKAALAEARLAFENGEMPIGAVIVHANAIVGRGRAEHQGRHSKIAHAEMNALLSAERFLKDHVHDGCVLYTTMEPCVMCLGAVAMSDIDHVVFALADKWMRPGRMRAIDYVDRHIHNYLGGVLEAEYAAMLEEYDPKMLAMIRNGCV